MKQWGAEWLLPIIQLLAEMVKAKLNRLSDLYPQKLHSSEIIDWGSWIHEITRVNSWIQLYIVRLPAFCAIFLPRFLYLQRWCCRYICLQIPKGQYIDNAGEIDYDQLYAQVKSISCAQILEIIHEKFSSVDVS